MLENSTKDIPQEEALFRSNQKSSSPPVVAHLFMRILTFAHLAWSTFRRLYGNCISH